LGLFDPKRKILSPDIFASETKMRSDVQAYVLEKLIEMIPVQLIWRVTLVGSLTGYYYNESSDFDTQIELTSPTKVEYYINITKEVNRSGINKIKRHPLHFNVYNKFPDGVSTANLTGAFDILNNKFIKTSVDPPPTFKHTVEILRPYNSLLENAFKMQIDQVKANPTVEEAKDVYNLYEDVDKTRKLYYDYIPVPRFSQGNITYKKIEQKYQDMPEKIHHLVRKIINGE
jgi:hypothetical protein